MRVEHLPILLFGLFLVPTLTPATEALAVAAPITQVLVFPDRAEVVRTLALELPAGRSVIEIDGLPAESLDERTLRCLPLGESGLRVVNLQSDIHQPQQRQRAAEVRFAAARQEIEAAIRAHEDRLVAISGRGRLLGEYRAHLLAGIGREVAGARPPVERWRESIAFIVDQAQSLAARSRETELAIFALKERLAEEQARLQLAGGEETTQAVRRVHLWVDQPQPGHRALELRYLVRQGVQWGMRYEVRLDRSRSRAELTALVGVSQQTGEDWTDAELVFSTRKPERGLRPPQLAGLVLGVRSTGTTTAAPVMTQVARTPATPETGTADTPAPAVADDQDQAPDHLAPARARQIPTGLRIRPVTGTLEELEYVGRETITVRADGRLALVSLGTWEAPCDWRFETVPEVLPAVFVRGVFANPAGVPLLAGTAEAHLDGRHIGEVVFPEVATGAAVALPFGSVEDLAVVRRAEPMSRVTREAAGEQETMREFVQDIIIEVINHAAEPQRVLVREAMPVSAVDSVQVTLAEETTPAEDLGEGLLQWSVDLDPGASRSLRLRYVIGIAQDFRR